MARPEILLTFLLGIAWPLIWMFWLVVRDERLSQKDTIDHIWNTDDPFIDNTPSMPDSDHWTYFLDCGRPGCIICADDRLDHQLTHPTCSFTEPHTHSDA